MYRLLRLIACVLAVVFAASGVQRVTRPGASPWTVAHGVARMAFGAGVFLGSFRGVIRGRPPEPSPPEGN